MVRHDMNQHRKMTRLKEPITPWFFIMKRERLGVTGVEYADPVTAAEFASRSCTCRPSSSVLIYMGEIERPDPSPMRQLVRVRRETIPGAHPFRFP